MHNSTSLSNSSINPITTPSTSNSMVDPPRNQILGGNGGNNGG